LRKDVRADLAAVEIADEDAVRSSRQQERQLAQILASRPGQSKA
jgi:hypothetical protein